MNVVGMNVDERLEVVGWHCGEKQRGILLKAVVVVWHAPSYFSKTFSCRGNDKPMVADSSVCWRWNQRIHIRVFFIAVIKMRPHERIVAKSLASRYGKSQCPLFHGQFSCSLDDKVGAISLIEDFSDVIGAGANVKSGQFQDKKHNNLQHFPVAGKPWRLQGRGLDVSFVLLVRHVVIPLGRKISYL